MRILLIGGAGMLGSRLATKLQQEDYDVAVVDNFSGSIKSRFSDKIKLFVADTTQLSSLVSVFNNFKPEIIFVCLAHSYKKDSIYDFYDDCRITLDSANAICRLLNKETKQVVYCSSSEVYGGPETKKSLKENRKINISATHTGAAYWAAESLFRFRCTELSIPLAILRIFDLFGPRIVFSPKTDVVNFIITSLLDQEQFGVVGGNLLRDFIYVDDAVSAGFAAIKKRVNGIYNIGSGKGIKLKNLVSLLCKKIKSLYPPEYPVKKDKLLYSAVADISESKSKLDWEPKTNLIDKLDELISFRKQEQALSLDPAAILKRMRGNY